MIREAAAKDASSLEVLYRILLPDREGIKVLPDRIGQIAANPGSFLYIYEKDGEAVATAHLHLCMDALCGDRPFAVIERVVTLPQHRGQGVGEALMRHAEAVACAHGAQKIMLSSNARRTDAHRFYERLGYDGDRSRLFTKMLKLTNDGQELKDNQ
ncbi:GNAT family N-acetyltransferase ['Paenibacillus yunnanensis' Narsing Rao et al. 2020]|uniref:GNAT family N-acetyltransferase n=1 Tax=Paenibacillus tengchongensis TaxID=2608684 RepID=UPI00124F5787|nr:GNAT family N-acetyltransferase [Paenibacillus tengchongensis]